MAAAAIPLAASFLGPMLGKLFGGNPGKKTRKMLRQFLQRMMPMIEGELRQRQQDWRERYSGFQSSYGTAMPFLRGLVPTSFNQLSPYASSLRDQSLQSFLSGQESARVGGLGVLNRRFGPGRASAGQYASFLGPLARAESAGRTDIKRQAVQENTRMGLVGSEGMRGWEDLGRAWAGQGDPVAGTVPFANLAAAGGLQSTGGFGANIDFNSMLTQLMDIFGQKGQGGGKFDVGNKGFNELLKYQRTWPSTPTFMGLY